MLHSTDKKARGTEILKRAMANFLLSEASSKTLITVTRVEFNKVGTIAFVYCAIYPDAQRVAAEQFLKRKARMAKEYIKKNTRLKVIPAVRFVTDLGFEKSQRIEELLKQE